MNKVESIQFRILHVPFVSMIPSSKPWLKNICDNTHEEQTLRNEEKIANKISEK